MQDQTRPHRSTRSTDHHDVLVVGARAAGASTAMLLARQGHDVLVVDRGRMPTDTLSTHALTRGGIVQLRRWGLLDAVVESGAPRIRRVSYHLPGHSPAVRDIALRAGVDFLLAPRRYALDEILLDAARDAGASVETQVTVTGVTRDGSGRVHGVRVREFDGTEREIRARMVVGADGVRSRIAREVDARVLDERRADGAAHYTYVTGFAHDEIELHAGERGFAGVFPTHDGEANVWLTVPADRALHAGDDRCSSFVELLGTIAPSLAARVEAATIIAPVRGAVGLPNHVLAPAGPGWALVGDAGYHRDPITAHGMTDAFRDADLLAGHLGCALSGRAPEAEALAAYGAERWRALQPIFNVTTALAAYPPLAEITKLQRKANLLLDLEAEWLAGRAALPTCAELVAA